MYTFALLILAAVLEVGGDALIRSGLKSGGAALIISGVAVLAIYGFMVNLTKLNFSHLMGLYIVTFFVVAQAIAVVVFKERPHPSVYAGGSLIAIGGLVMAIWQK